MLGLTGLDGFFFYVVAQLVRPSRHRPAQPCSRLIGAALAAGVLGAAREDGDGYQAMCAAASAPSPLLRRLPARLTLPPPTLADFPYGVQGLLTSQLTGGLLVRPAPSRPLPPPAHRSYAAVAWADCVPVCDRSRICYSGRSSTISVICTRRHDRYMNAAALAQKQLACTTYHVHARLLCRVIPLSGGRGGVSRRDV